MLTEISKKYELILGSASPRRKKILTDLGLTFKVKQQEVEEVFPNDLSGKAIAEYLAKLKADAYTLNNNQIVITGDTIVVQQGNVLGKPKSDNEAKQMLTALSGNKHEVISAICLKSNQKTIVLSDCTQVYFNPLTTTEIAYYISNYQPFDKAGAYGIQEWIGQIGIHKIEGSFYTVMGMPVHLLYQALKTF